MTLLVISAQTYSGDFVSRESCSFMRLNNAFRKTLLKAAKKTPSQRIIGSYEKLFSWCVCGGRLTASEKSIYCSLYGKYPVPIQ